MNALNRQHLEKYLHLLSKFVSGKISAQEFETNFLSLRRNDEYWMSGQFEPEIGKILDAFFLDIDAYASPELYEPSDKFDINENEFKVRAKEAFAQLQEISFNPEILRTTSANLHFRTLVTQLDAELRMMYAELMDTYDQHNVIEHNDTVVIAYLDNEPVGCGCFKRFDTASAELKRMFVHPDARGKGISKLIISELEAWARELGFTQTILETGTKNFDAHHLYRKSGYIDIPHYGPYIDLESSICMGKLLNQNLQD